MSNDTISIKQASTGKGQAESAQPKGPTDKDARRAEALRANLKKRRTQNQKRNETPAIIALQKPE